MQTFCDPTPKLIPAQAEYNRDTMDQPNCYWTLTDELVTIIGLYSNVPSGGVIEMDQTFIIHVHQRLHDLVVIVIAIVLERFMEVRHAVDRRA